MLNAPNPCAGLNALPDPNEPDPNAVVGSVASPPDVIGEATGGPKTPDASPNGEGFLESESLLPSDSPPNVPEVPSVIKSSSGADASEFMASEEASGAGCGVGLAPNLKLDCANALGPEAENALKAPPDDADPPVPDKAEVCPKLG